MSLRHVRHLLEHVHPELPAHHRGNRGWPAGRFTRFDCDRARDGRTACPLNTRRAGQSSAPPLRVPSGGVNQTPAAEDHDEDDADYSGDDACEFHLPKPRLGSNNAFGPVRAVL